MNYQEFIDQRITDMKELMNFIPELTPQFSVFIEAMTDEREYGEPLFTAIKEKLEEVLKRELSLSDTNVYWQVVCHYAFTTADIDIDDEVPTAADKIANKLEELLGITLDERLRKAIRCLAEKVMSL